VRGSCTAHEVPQLAFGVGHASVTLLPFSPSGVPTTAVLVRRKVSSGANLGGLQQENSFRALPVASTAPRPAAYGPAMALSTPRSEMVLLQPVMQHKHK
jgi:hypothetical protein